MKPLVIFEIANNHMGDIKHGLKIIKTYYNISKKYRNLIDFAVKFQFRDLNTFIHQNFLNTDHPQVKRFTDTKLTSFEWNKLINFSKKNFKVICTAFDEKSVESIVKKKFDYLKIASCSMDEWPLLEHIAKKAKSKKIICSLGGASLEEIRKTVSFFSNRKMDVSYLYCVAKYPTEPSDLNLEFFHHLKSIYKDKIKGFSSHEIPDEKLSASLAYAMGAKIFEKHVGIKSKKYNLNKYSTSPEQMNNWLSNLKSAIERCGTTKNRKKFMPKEKNNLLQFKRGIYLKKNIIKNKGDIIEIKDIEFAFPNIKNQYISNDFSVSRKFFAKQNIKGGSALLKNNVKTIYKRDKIEAIRLRVLDLLEKSKVTVVKEARLEISHHYGINHFNKYGMVMITILNSIYCKKLLFIFHKQQHPPQFHLKKQETFFVLYGKVKVHITKKNKKKSMILKTGDIITIMPREIHSFLGVTKDGAVIEELSTTSSSKDSFYIDSKITKNVNRKSFISIK